MTEQASFLDAMRLPEGLDTRCACRWYDEQTHDLCEEAQKLYDACGPEIEEHVRRTMAGESRESLKTTFPMPACQAYLTHVSRAHDRERQWAMAWYDAAIASDSR